VQLTSGDPHSLQNFIKVGCYSRYTGDGREDFRGIRRRQRDQGRYDVSLPSSVIGHRDLQFASLAGSHMGLKCH
jgi:hypothetical protein